MESDNQQLVGQLVFDTQSLGERAMDKEIEVEVGDGGGDAQVVSSTPCWHILKDRPRLCEIIHGQKAQYTIIALVIIDCIIVIAELLVDLEILKVHHDNPAPHILHDVSIAILSLFIIELIVKIYAMGMEFFHHKLEVFDGIVVIVSFALDIAFSGGNAAEGASLLIILRLWRVTRIVNGIILSVKMQDEKKIHHLHKVIEELQEELDRLKTRNAELENELKTLKGTKEEPVAEEATT
ncbi:predicted protein [Nematostella vectensis]|uniref:Voltage-gated hydrogen channel 1 n=1 Tax=Nematostella vectensis TaxID=45351 RepID=A7SPG1_NEMVE|nr:predicted protein [Nematostella vectensis]|eukprot:XP_001626501.1 predicted protein [Nematostella vectensis]